MCSSRFILCIGIILSISSWVLVSFFPFILAGFIFFFKLLWVDSVCGILGLGDLRAGSLPSSLTSSESSLSLFSLSSCSLFRCQVHCSPYCCLMHYQSHHHHQRPTSWFLGVMFLLQQLSCFLHLFLFEVSFSLLIGLNFQCQNVMLQGPQLLIVILEESFGSAINCYIHIYFF